jgi:hypothetical protein
MKEWKNPVIICLNVEATEMYDAGGANDGGYIDNPSGNEGFQTVPGHVGHS